jgi:hypothetical protein
MRRIGLEQRNCSPPTIKCNGVRKEGLSKNLTFSTDCIQPCHSLQPTWRPIRSMDTSTIGGWVPHKSLAFHTDTTTDASTCISFPWVSQWPDAPCESTSRARACGGILFPRCVCHSYPQNRTTVACATPNFCLPLKKNERQRPTRNTLSEPNQPCRRIAGKPRHRLPR